MSHRVFVISVEEDWDEAELRTIIRDGVREHYIEMLKQLQIHEIELKNVLGLSVDHTGTIHNERPV